MIVSKTTDIGATWIRYQLTTTPGETQAIAVAPSNSDIVYAGGTANSGSALFRTIDGGSNWNDISTGLTGYVNALTVDPDNADIVYAGTNDSVFKSVDGGLSWNSTGLSASVTALLIDPESTNTVFAGTRYNAVMVTKNGGGDWQGMKQGLDTNYVTCLGIDPGTYLYAGTVRCGLYRMEWILGVAEHREVTHEQSYCIYPNPMCDETEITYALRCDSPVNVAIYDVQGRLVKTITDTPGGVGRNSIQWSGTDVSGKKVPAGVYFAMLTASGKQLVAKITVVR